MTLGLPAIWWLLFLPFSVFAQNPPDQNAAVPGQIVIDPGHGGKAHGAMGVYGKPEKDIALQIAQRLRQEIKKELHLPTHLTRNADVFLDLKDRTRLANQAGADLFISIHCNSFPHGPGQARVKGIETYFLSTEATGEQAHLVAARENAEVPFSSSANTLSAILTDLVQTQAHHQSSTLAYQVHQKLVNRLKAVNRGVQQAPFVVLMGARMPAILVEVGFLSNPQEAKKLSQSSYQQQIAKAITQGIADFLRKKTLYRSAAEPHVTKATSNQ